jgi:hypothetical protein
MARRARLAVLGVLALVVGCGAPRIDASSEQRAVASLERLRDSLPEEKRLEFDRAVLAIVRSEMDEKGLPRLEAAGPGAFDARALEPLDGMTAEEVITEARRIAADAAQRDSARRPSTPRP